MEHGYSENERHIVDDGFPSVRFIVSLYSVGALASLALAFKSGIDSAQTTNCLFISWLLALGALAMSVFSEVTESAEDID